MAWFAPQISVFSRGAAGAPSTGKAAYRSGERIEDERTGIVHDYRARSGVEWSGMGSAAAAPDWTRNRSALWNAAELKENRKNSVTAREIMVPLPAEVTQAERQRITQEIMAWLVERYGVAVDASIHAPNRKGDERNYHAHIMFTTRSVGPEGWGGKTRVLDESVRKRADGQSIGGKEIEAIRAELAAITNRALERSGIDYRVDHRSYERQGIDREAEPHLGPAATQIERDGKQSEKGDQKRETQARNAERDAMRKELDAVEFVLDREDLRDTGELDVEEPEQAKPRSAADIMRGNEALSLDGLTAQHSTFTRRDMARLISRHTATAEEFAAVLAKLESDPQLVRLGKDAQGQPRFTTRTMQAIEQRMDGHAEAMHGRNRHQTRPAMQSGSVTLGADQKAALDHILHGPDLCAVTGFAGSGKSTMLNAARQSWERAGYRVQGMALAGAAADGLQQGAGIDSNTIHSRLFQWDKGDNLPTAKDILVIDEAGMVGSRLMERVLAHAVRAGAKVVLVGDVEQLQAIEAGGALNAIIKRTGAAELTTIRRQSESWQQQATRDLATGETGAALDRYEQAGMVHGHATSDEAKQAIIEGWNQARQESPAESQIILAATNDHVGDLNRLAREKMKEAGQLGADHELQTSKGKADFATGDRVYFLKNDRKLGVRNGSLATITAITGQTVTVKLDGGRQLTFDAVSYSQFAHGYAATIHKSQGVTVDRAHVLATSHLDRHGAYVGMTRHRSRLDVHWGRDSIRDRDALTRILSRERLKDTSLDYGDEGEDRTAGGAAGRAGKRTAGGRHDDPPRPTSDQTARPGAAPPKPDAPASRSIEREKARFAQWVNAKRAELQSRRHDDEIELGRGQQIERATFDKERAKAEPARRRQEAALAAVTRQQQKTGLAGFVYRVSGEAAKDRARADAITKTMADLTRRQAERRQVLTTRHAAERDNLGQRYARDASQLEQHIDRAGAKREREGWLAQPFQRAAGTDRSAEADRPAEAQNRPLDATNDFGEAAPPREPEATHGANPAQDEAIARAAREAAEEAAQIEAAHAADRARAAQSHERDMGMEI